MKRKRLACFCNEFFKGKDCDHGKVCGLWEVFQNEKCQVVDEAEQEAPPNLCEMFDADFIKPIDDDQ